MSVEVSARPQACDIGISRRGCEMAEDAVGGPAARVFLSAFEPDSAVPVEHDRQRRITHRETVALSGKYEEKIWRRGSESNRRIKVLQTSPLPLGYRAPDLRKRLRHWEAGKNLERETGFEPATSTLARSHSTAELLPLVGSILPQRLCGRSAH